MSEFIPDPEAARLIQQFGIEDDETSEDGYTKTSKLRNGETLTQHLGPRQWEYSGSLDATLEQDPEPTAAQAIDAQEHAAAPATEVASGDVNDGPPADPSTPTVEVQDKVNEPGPSETATPDNGQDAALPGADQPLEPATPAEG